MGNHHCRNHEHGHAFGDFHARTREGLVVTSRRSMLQASLAAIGPQAAPARQLTKSTHQLARHFLETASRQRVGAMNNERRTTDTN